MNSIFFALLILSCASFAFVNASKCPANDFPKCQQGSLDLSRYTGVWYTQLQSGSFFIGANCFCETANYTIKADGSVNVDNKCRKGSINAELTGSVGTAVMTNLTSPCDLSVTFPPSPVGSPYDVLRTDYETYTIVYSCFGSVGRLLNIDDIWVLTRKPVADPALMKSIVLELQGYGFDLSDLAPITQDGCPSVQ